MRVGLSYWGLCVPFGQYDPLDTPDGHRYGRPMFVDALRARGHTVYALQQRRELIPYPGLDYSTGFPDIDVLLVEWRWPTHKNSGPDPKEPDLVRQRELLAYYDCPTVLWDMDAKLTPEDEAKYPRAVLADTMLYRPTYTRPRIYLPLWTDCKLLLPPADAYPVYGYIGNNYERDGEFERYYFGASVHGVQTMMFGNWLQTSPERRPPAELVAANLGVSFGFRYDYTTSMRMLNRFLCTTHVSKPEYYARGQTPPRYFEAAAVGCPALVPIDSRLGLFNRWRVSGTDDVERWITTFQSPTLRREAVEEQLDELRQHTEYDVRNAVQFLESLCG